MRRSDVMVTGGAGFLGSHVVTRLEHDGFSVAVVRSSEFDLRTPDACQAALRTFSPKIVVHLAAVVGGIGANLAAPATFLHDNAVMGLHLIEAARHVPNLERFVCVGTVCSYPRSAPIPLREDDLWAGYPEETNAPYGMAKKLLLVQLDAYRKQYAFPGVYLIPTNLYGPGDDLDLRTSHVIPALINRCLDAVARGARSITCWGSGSASREFLNVRDAARAVAMAAARYSAPEPMNLGSGHEIVMRDLAGLIARLAGFEGEIRWDNVRPDGQPRRRLDVSRAERALGFRAEVPLEEGLRETIDWVRQVRRDSA